VAAAGNAAGKAAYGDRPGSANGQQGGKKLIPLRQVSALLQQLLTHLQEALAVIGQQHSITAMQQGTL
jgi:hypothetical protein